MKWAFIDYENINCLSKVKLDDYAKILIFVGAKQPKINFGEKKYHVPLDMLIIQIQTVQSNNLDFHLAYYLGKYDQEVDKNIIFEVISNDNGYSPLIAHIRANSRPCRQIKISLEHDKKPTPKPPNSHLTATEQLHNLIKSQPIEKRPQKVESLKNHIAAQLHIQGNDAAIQNYFNHLVNNRLITVNAEKITYPK